METRAKCLLLLFRALILKNCVLLLPGFWDAVLRDRHKYLSSNSAGVGSGHGAGWVLAEEVAGLGGAIGRESRGCSLLQITEASP